MTQKCQCHHTRSLPGEDFRRRCRNQAVTTASCEFSDGVHTINVCAFHATILRRKGIWKVAGGEK